MDIFASGGGLDGPMYGAVTGGKGQEGEGAELAEANVYGLVQNNTTPCDCKGLHSMTPRRLELRLPG